MKLRYLFLSLILCLSILLVGCGVEETEKTSNGPSITETQTEEKTENPTNDETQNTEVVLENIYVQNTDELYCNLGEAFNPAKLSIIAKYSNGTEENITGKVSFSAVSTTTEGEKELVITYNSFSVKVNVNVLKTIGIEIDTSNVKVNYNIGDIIDISGLLVFNLYDDEEKKQQNTYSIKIYDQQGNLMPVTGSFEKAGTYKICVEYSGYIEEYDIMVGQLDEPDVQEFYQCLELDLSNVKTTFAGEHFSYNDLIVNAVKNDGTKVKLTSDEYTVSLLNGSFTETGTYEVIVKYRGTTNIIDPKVEYSVTYTKVVVTFGYSGVPYEDFQVEIKSTNPADYLKAPAGYYAVNFSHPFDEWEDAGLVKIYCEKITNGKVPLVLLEEDCTLNPTVLWYSVNQSVSLSSIAAIPANIPEGMEFSHWKLPNSFNMTNPVYASPVFVLEGFDSQSLTEDETVNKISANTIDVNFEEFITATPEGYNLDSITLSLNGVIIAEIPYEEGVTSAYFENLENETEYEIGAYYEQDDSSTLALRRNKKFTYRFHFNGFMVITHGDVLYRIRMMYNGDCLYRWYFAEGTKVRSDHELYKFELPMEYENYRCIGMNAKVDTVTQDLDIELIMVCLDDSICTVVFYDRNNNIIEIKNVSVGDSITDTPTLESYYNSDNSVRYDFAGWSSDLTSIKNDLFLSPKFDYVYLNPLEVNTEFFIGDTFADVYLSINNTSVIKDLAFNIYDMAGNLIEELKPSYISSKNRFTTLKLTKSTDYNVVISYTNRENTEPLEVENITKITTLSGEEKTNNKVTFSNITYCEFNINCDKQVYGFYSLKLDDNNNIVDIRKYIDDSYYVQNTTYYINCIVEDPTDENMYYIYRDDYEVTLLDAKKPEILEARVNYIKNDYIHLEFKINDPDKTIYSIVPNIEIREINETFLPILYYDCGYFNYNSKTGYYEYIFPCYGTDPETGQSVTYRWEIWNIDVNYIYDGTFYNEIFNFECFVDGYKYFYTYEMYRNSYLDVKVDTTNVQKEFTNEQLNTTGLRVFINKGDGTKIEIFEEDYEITLYKGEQKVQVFTEPGKYKVAIKYKGDIKLIYLDNTEYYVTYEK